MMDIVGAFGVIGIASISASLYVLGALSRQLGRVTGSGPFFWGFYLAALLVAVGFLARLFGTLALNSDFDQNIVWVLLYNGIPALGVTLGVIIAWRYWSWLLAERG